MSCHSLCSCCLVIQSCLTLCDPMDGSTTGFPVLYHLQILLKLMTIELVMPSHPLLSPCPPAFNLSQNQGLFYESALFIGWPMYWSFSFSISPSNVYSLLISLRINWFDLFAVQGTLVFSNNTVQKHQFFDVHPSL